MEKGPSLIIGIFNTTGETKRERKIVEASHRLQNSPYFCVFKYARAVRQKVWNEVENRERDWGETLKIRIFSLASHAREARDLRPRKTLTPRFTDFEKKTDCFAV